MKPPSDKVSFFGIFSFFFRLSWTAFGGPLAYISMMEDDCVEKRRWLSKDEFAEMLGITKMPDFRRHAIEELTLVDEYFAWIIPDGLHYVGTLYPGNQVLGISHTEQFSDGLFTMRKFCKTLVEESEYRHALLQCELSEHVVLREINAEGEER